MELCTEKWAQRLSAVEQELDALRATFQLRWEADQRAIARWQQECGEEVCWPDHADLVMWLVERLGMAEAVIEAAREQGKAKIPADRERGEFEAAALHLALMVATFDKRYGTADPETSEA